MDFYDKMVTDHPLVEYLEDCFALSDLKGLKKYIGRCQQSNKLKVGVKQLFKSNLSLIKEYTTLIQPESDEEDEADKQEQPPAETTTIEEKRDSTPEPLEQLKDKNSKKAGSKASKREIVPEEAPKEENVADPNADKVIPHVIHLKRDVLKMTSSYIQKMQYLLTIKKDGDCNLVIEDNQFESLQADIVDLAFSSGNVEYLNLSGLGKPEKSVKVERYVRILEQIKEMSQFTNNQTEGDEAIKM